MLSKFIVNNFKNFENELVFNLSNIKNYEFNSECVKDSTINKAIVYGPNGSGKSNLGFAIFDIVSHLTDKNKQPEFYTNYLFGGDADRIATFQYFFTFDNKTLEYHYGKRSQDEIVFEKLSIDGKDVISIDKRLSTEAKIELKGAETLNKDMRSTKISVIKYILSNSILENNATNQVLASFNKFVDDGFGVIILIPSNLISNVEETKRSPKYNYKINYLFTIKMPFPLPVFNYPL